MQGIFQLEAVMPPGTALMIFFFTFSHIFLILRYFPNFARFLDIE